MTTSTYPRWALPLRVRVGAVLCAIGLALTFAVPAEASNTYHSGWTSSNARYNGSGSMAANFNRMVNNDYPQRVPDRLTISYRTPNYSYEYYLRTSYGGSSVSISATKQYNDVASCRTSLSTNATCVTANGV